VHSRSPVHPGGLPRNLPRPADGTGYRLTAARPEALTPGFYWAMHRTSNRTAIGQARRAIARGASRPRLPSFVANTSKGRPRREAPGRAGRGPPCRVAPPPRPDPGNLRRRTPFTQASAHALAQPSLYRRGRMTCRSGGKNGSSSHPRTKPPRKQSSAATIPATTSPATHHATPPATTASATDTGQYRLMIAGASRTLLTTASVVVPAYARR
jgi:hypothetical protein